VAQGLFIYQRNGTTFTKLDDPASLPTSIVRGSTWSPDGKYLSLAHNGSPYVTVYERDDTTFTRLADPASLPTNTGNKPTWSPDGQFLSVAGFTSPYLNIYQTPEDMPTSGIVKIIGQPLAGA
jgi:Tol biopolymer transport system component